MTKPTDRVQGAVPGNLLDGASSPVLLVRDDLDEVVVYDAECVHLEQMDTGHWWLRIDRRGEPAIVVNLSTARGARIRGMAELD